MNTSAIIAYQNLAAYAYRRGNQTLAAYWSHLARASMGLEQRREFNPLMIAA